MAVVSLVFLTYPMMGKILSEAKINTIKKQAHKPDSVSVNTDPYHLSRPLVTQKLHPPTLRLGHATLITPVYVAFHRIEFT